MKKCYYWIFLLIFILLFRFTASAEGFAGAEQRLSIDAKMMSLAGAYDSISDSVESVYYNPAGLTAVRDIMLLCSYLPVWDNLTTVYFIGSAFQTKYLPIGIGILNMNTDGISVRSTTPEVSKTMNYQDISFYLSSAYSILPGLSGGIRLKVIHKSILNYSDTGIGADISVLWRKENPYAYTKSEFMKIVQPISFGVIINNILPPTIKLKEEKERNPLQIRNSISYRFKKSLNFFKPEIGMGMEMVPEYESYILSMGIDLSLWETLYIRSGYKITDNIFTIGTGVKMRNIMIDYGMSALVVDRSLYTLNVKVFF